MDLKFKIQNSKLITLNSLLFFILIFCQLSTVNCQLSFAAYGDAKLTVNADVRTESLTLEPQASATPTPQEGQVYFDDTTSQPYYYDGTDWKVVSAGAGGGGDKTVATKIVAVKRNPPNPALDSLDTSCADYICDGNWDQEQINMAINDLPAQGGVVYLLEGTYSICSCLFDGETLTGINLHSNVALIGAGAGTKIEVYTACGGPVSIIRATNTSNVLVSNLMIDGNSKADSGHNGIYFNNVTNSKIDNVWVANFVNYGIYFVSSNYNMISSIFAYDNASYSVYLKSSNNNSISDNYIQSPNSYCIVLNSACNNLITNNQLVQVNAVIAGGISLGNSSNNNLITANYISSPMRPIGITSSNYNIICENSIKGGGPFNSEGIFIMSADYNVVSNNNLNTGNNCDPIRLYMDSDNNVISTNLSYNIYYESTISVENNSDNNIITGNQGICTMSTNQPGIWIMEANCINNYLSANALINYGPISDSGTNTKYTDKTKLTLEPGSAAALVNSGTLTPSGPTSYLRLVPTSDITLGSGSNVAIAAGKSAGDLLILENATTTNNKISISQTTGLKLSVYPRVLNLNDILTLIWNGSDWIETAFAHN